MISIPKAQLLDYPVHLVTGFQALDFAQQSIRDEQTLQVVTLNPEMIMQGDQDPALGKILREADLILPDGAGLVWALRQRGHVVNRLPGIEFSDSLLHWAAQSDQPVAIIGAVDLVLQDAVQNLKQRHPGLRVVYAHHGFFKAGEEEQVIVETCAAQQPKIILVALGVPRQEKWIAQYKHLFNGAVLVGVGGSLDVWSGKTQRAPEIMRQLNLEWLYRITTEPWRIQRIYKTLPLFVVKVLLSPSGA